MSNRNILSKIQKIYTDNPQRLNIIEEQIDLEIQMNYFKRSTMLKKQVVELEDVLEKIPTLYDPEARLEEKRDILIFLASFEDIESFRFLEKFKNEATGEIKLWASMAYRESKMLLESSLLEDENQILISTGLGGKGDCLRYFICLVHRDEALFSEVQERIIKNEFTSSTEKNQAVIESLQFENHLVKVFLLVPITAEIRSIVADVVDASVELGGFLDEHVIVTNVRAFSNEEIDAIVQGKLREEDLIGIDSLEDLPYMDIDDDDDIDEEDDGDDDDIDF